MSPIRAAVPLDTLIELISAIRSSHDEIDAWLAAAETTFPVIQDRGFSLDSGG
jgi:hypothetical protein